MYLDYMCGRTKTNRPIWYSQRSKIAFLILPRVVTVFSRFDKEPKDISQGSIDLRESYIGIKTEEGVLHRDKGIWYLEDNPCVPRLIMSMFSPDVIPIEEWNTDIVVCGKMHNKPIYYVKEDKTFWVKWEGTFCKKLTWSSAGEEGVDIRNFSTPYCDDYVATNDGLIPFSTSAVCVGVFDWHLGGIKNLADINAHLPVILKRYAEKGTL